MGNTYQRLRKFEEAIKTQDMVLKMDPKNLVALNNKGDSLNTLGKWVFIFFWKILFSNFNKN